MKLIKVLLFCLMLSIVVKPVSASEVINDPLLLFQEDLQSYYEGKNFEFEDENGNNITVVIFEHRNEFYLAKEETSEKLFDMIGSYGEIANNDISLCSITSTSYTWKKYRIKVTNSSLIQTDIKVSASYDTSTKKIKNPTGKFLNITYVGKYKMDSVSTSYTISNNKAINYTFTLKCSIFGDNIRTIKVKKSWTPSF